MSDLDHKKCQVCEGGIPPLDEASIQAALQDVAQWSYDQECRCLKRRFEFKGYARTVQFVNAIVWIAQDQKHHPDIHFGYNYCEVCYQTHAADGVTENDFICARAINALLDEV